MATTVYFSVDQRSYDKALQLSINDEHGGYRIAGPDYDGNGKTLLKRPITERDINEMRMYLNKAAQQLRQQG